MSSPGTRHVRASPSTVSSVSSLGVSNRQAATNAPVSRTPSEPSVASRTVNSGPSNKEPTFITSKWGIGWQTISLMLGSYVLAIIVGAGHLLLFSLLDGKPADGPNQAIPQAYVSTISNILANVFGFALRGALAVAFAQYLWRLLRIEAMKVSTIELLFNIRSNIFVLLRPAALKATPVLFALAILMWSSQVVISFPPGALTVESAQKISWGVRVVPTFNASFMGDGSGADANKFSLINLDPAPPIGFTVGDFSNVNNTNLINRVARQVLNTGETFPMPSPCGVNCSYVMEFDGPLISCKQTTTTMIYNGTTVPPYFLIYSGQWIGNPTAHLIHSSYNGTYTQATFNGTTLDPIAGNAALFNGEVKAPGFNAPSGLGFGTTPAEWDDFTLAYYRDNNMMAIFAAMMTWLNGAFQAMPALNPQSLNATAYNDIVWKELIHTDARGVTGRESAKNGTIVDSTRFNTAFGKYFALEPAHPSFNINQDLINDCLFNMTISMMVAYGNWNTTVNTTESTLINVYSFSRPLNLILPYFISLGLALPFIIVGCLALIWNGVPATDGSFMQIITTSTGSAILDRAAAGGCLGGEENAPQELKDLEIRFGEFIGRDEPGRIKRAGFGVEGEVMA